MKNLILSTLLVFPVLLFAQVSLDLEKSKVKWTGKK